MVELSGELEAYWEQGWEGYIAFAFRDPLQDRPIFLENGHHLTIYDHGDRLIWSGKIQLVKRGFFDRHSLDVEIWSGTKQKGVSYQNWMAWFWHKPPLKAKLIR
jgi:hypothetical protein